MLRRKREQNASSLLIHRCGIRSTVGAEQDGFMKCLFSAVRTMVRTGLEARKMTDEVADCVQSMFLAEFCQSCGSVERQACEHDFEFRREICFEQSLASASEFEQGRIMIGFVEADETHGNQLLEARVERWAFGANGKWKVRRGERLCKHGVLQGSCVVVL